MLKQKGLLIVISLLFTACVSTHALKLSSVSHPPLSSDSVQVYVSEDEVKENFEKVATIEVKGSSIWKTKEALLKRLKEKAGAIGANGIILLDVKDRSLGVKALDLYFTAGLLTRKKIQAIAIFRFEDKK